MEKFSPERIFYNSCDFVNNLPEEILIEVFKFLSYKDRIEAALVCQRWFDTLQNMHNKKIVLIKTELSDDSEPVSIFLNSRQDYKCVTINQSDVLESPQFWQKFNNIKELEIRELDIKGKQLREILVPLVHLNRLKIINCRDLFMYNKVFSSERDGEVLRRCLRNLKDLSLADNRYLSDSTFQRIISLMPELESLDLSGCQICFHKGLYKKFYPNSSFQKGPSESILTFQFVLDFICRNPEKIKDLNFSRTLIDGDALEKLSKIEGFQLDKLVLSSCDQLTNTGIISILKNSHQLTYLDLSSSVRVTDQSLQNISKCSTNLKVLKLRLCRAITDLGVVCLEQLRSLEELDVSGCEFVTGKGIDELMKQPNYNMKRIHLSALANIHEDSVINLVKKAPKLEYLDLSSSRSGVSNRSVQEIFKNSIRLRELRLNYCDNISDAGILGSNLDEESNENPSFDQDFDERKISLRSRAEQEIVNDARLKNNMQKLCETNSGTINRSNSILNLRGLKVLELTGCNKVTDVSLMFCFQFLELKSISLSKCHQISTVGLTELVKNCPSIEVLNLSECQGIDDKTVKEITQSAKRLTELYIDRCMKLTDHSLDSIAMNCKYIRVLDIRGCRLMCPEPRMRLESIKTLRNVLISKPGPYSDSMATSKPIPPPFRF